MFDSILFQKYGLPHLQVPDRCMLFHSTVCQDFQRKSLHQDVLLEVKVVRKQIVGGRMKLLKVLVEDNTGNLEMLFFKARFLANMFHPGDFSRNLHTWNLIIAFGILNNMVYLFLLFFT